MKNNELNKVRKILKILSNDGKDKSVAYLSNAYKLNKKIDSEIDALEYAFPVYKKEYDEKEQQLFLEHSQKDENGNFILKNGCIPTEEGEVRLLDLELDDYDSFNTEYTELKKNTDWDKIEVETKDYNKFMEQESDVEFKKLKPYDGMDQKLFDVLADLEVIEIE